MTREAPAPVVDVTERIQSLGGAANTAVNLASLGGTVRMGGLGGQDAAGDRVRDLLLAAGVDVSGLVHSPRLRTTTKTRIVGDDQVIVRVDDVHRGSVHRDDARALARAALEATAGVDAEIVSDDGTGTLHGVVLESLAARTSRPGLTVWMRTIPPSGRRSAPTSSRRTRARPGASSTGPSRATRTAPPRSPRSATGSWPPPDP